MTKILLVEDDHLVASLVTKILARTKRQLLVARNGDEALKICRRSERLGMVISDIVMPGMSGPEWVQAAGDSLTDVPVAYISGYSDAAVSSHGWRIGDSELLAKPFHVHELLDLVERHLGE